MEWNEWLGVVSSILGIIAFIITIFRIFRKSYQIPIQFIIFGFILALVAILLGVIPSFNEGAIAMKWHNWLSVALGILSIHNLASRWMRIPEKYKDNKIFNPIIGLILVLPAILFSVIPLFMGSNSPVSEIIKITSPLNNSIVPVLNTVKGYSTTELKNNEHLYIIVEYDVVWWPQHGEVAVKYSQSSEKYVFCMTVGIGNYVEEDKGKAFTIIAVVVDDAVHEYFQSWFEQNTKNRTWPGIIYTEARQQGNVKIYDTVYVIREQ